MKVGFHLGAHCQSQDSGQLQKLKTQESKVVGWEYDHSVT